VIACVKIRIYTIFRYKLNNAHFDLFLAETFEVQPLSSSEGSSQNSPVRTGVKRQHKEYENTSMLDVTLPKKKRQQPISGFLNASSPSMTSTSGSIVGIDGSVPIIDATIEVYRFGTTKYCTKRNTIVSFDCVSELSETKKTLRKLYGLEDDARRVHIGAFIIDLGITPRSDSQLLDLPVFVAQSEKEWRNIITRLQNQLQHYLLLGE
jgi:hypothetical protein